MSSSNTPATASSRPSDASLTQEYNRRRTELSEIINKVSELERDADEHTLVLQTLAEVNEDDPDRKCFRMVGGILVQKTVKDILPQLKTNYQGVQSVIEQLSVTYKRREQEFEEFQKKNNIVVQRAPPARTYNQLAEQTCAAPQIRERAGIYASSRKA